MPRMSLRVGTPELIRSSIFWWMLDGWNSITAYPMESDLKTVCENLIRVGVKWTYSKYSVYLAISILDDEKCNVAVKLIVSVSLARSKPFLSSFKKSKMSFSPDDSFSMLNKLRIVNRYLNGLMKMRLTETLLVGLTYFPCQQNRYWPHQNH